MEKLKPCPFCGEEAQIFTDDEMGYLGNDQHLVKCGNCLFVEILKYGDLSECSITVSTRDHSSLHVMARYSSVEKALKVLDMIQEAYADAELIPMTVPNIGKMFQEAPASKENELLAEAIGKALMNRMVFQMPEDGSVEA